MNKSDLPIDFALGVNNTYRDISGNYSLRCYCKVGDGSGKVGGGGGKVGVGGGGWLVGVSGGRGVSVGGGGAGGREVSVGW